MVPDPISESFGALTVTVETGFRTRIVTVAVFVSLVAVMVAVPAETPVTVYPTVPAALETPDGGATVAAGALLEKAMVRPESGVAAAFVTVAVPVTCAGAITESADAVMLTFTGTCTVIADVPAVPPTVAVIIALPPAVPWAVTSPEALTVATAALVVVHAVVRPPNAAPLMAFVAESRGVAVSCWVCEEVSVADGGATSTEETATRSTVTLEVPDFPSLVAVMVTAPGPTPVTTPVPGSTCATA